MNLREFMFHVVSVCLAVSIAAANGLKDYCMNLIIRILLISLHLPMMKNMYPSMTMVMRRSVKPMFSNSLKTSGISIEMWRYGISLVLNMDRRQAAHTKHYHAIIYNLPDDALEPCSSWVKGKGLWKKDSMINRRLNDIWKRGFVTIGELTRQRCGYCAKYFVDKQEVDEIQVPNFNLMSRRPGIGMAHVESIKEKVRYFNSTSLLTDNGKYIQMPRYYQKKIYSDEERSERWHEHIDDINQRFDDLSQVVNNDPGFAEEIIKTHLRFGKSKSKI